MKKPFNLTLRAKEDMRGIWNYTASVWSETQADKYISSLYQRFAWLTEHPRIGKHRIDIQEGYYCFPEGSHLIFYMIHDDVIDIIGIPHREMDIPGFFE